MTIHFNFPNKDEVLGYLLDIKNDTITFLDLSIIKQDIVAKEDKAEWLKPETRVPHNEAHMTVINFFK